VGKQSRKKYIVGQKKNKKIEKWGRKRKSAKKGVTRRTGASWEGADVLGRPGIQRKGEKRTL